jgi:hypothetical protein
MANKRANRMAETRESEDRDAIERAILDMDYRDSMYIPPNLAPEGWVYKWGNYSIFGEPLPQNMMKLRRKGWTPVPADRHPEFAFEIFGNSDPNMRGFIYRSGSVLIERRKEYEDMENREIERVNTEALLNMPGAESFTGVPGLPVRDNSEAYAAHHVLNPKSAAFGR